MVPPIRFVFVLHNHQPVGNFDEVFEQSYQDAYLPFMNLIDRYPTFPFVLHTSGSLIEWLADHHPEYLERLAEKVETGQAEILGGVQYEAILSMLPRRDRIGQIKNYTKWLSENLGAEIRGMWMPERVWEPQMVSDLAEAGIEYTLLDDFHFKCAGLEETELWGYYLSEDEGKLLKIFPDSERLRYTIPFAEPHETITYLQQIAEKRPGSVLVFGDDGEKFGSWPKTYQHVYENRWLEKFFDLVLANQDWIQVTTLAESVDNVPPIGKVYLPNASYREMTEWALPTERQLEFETIQQDLKKSGKWDQVAKFMRGGLWRNFKYKYPETDEMYNRMMMVSQRLHEVEQSQNGSQVDQAKTELYRGQCNCSYWHGAFGGLYLPHLRHAIYNHLIAADNLLEDLAHSTDTWVEIQSDDFNLDARQEVKLNNDQLLALFAPSRGGMLYELDVRKICLNVAATLSRRPESYHRIVLAGANADMGSMASIQEEVIFKQEGLDQKLHYDTYPRKSLQDHFYEVEVSHASVANNQAKELGDFVEGVYEAKLRRSEDSAQLYLSRQGNVANQKVTVEKNISMQAGSSKLKIKYRLSGLPQDHPFHFGVEFNFAGLPSKADDRYFYQTDEKKLGQLQTELDLAQCDMIGLKDEWQGIGLELAFSEPSSVWTFPIESVSQSEGGYELVHQSVVVHPHWIIQADNDGCWEMTINLKIDTSLAESRMQPQTEAATL